MKRKLFDLIKEEWTRKGFPEDCTSGAVVPLRKKGDPNVADNFRGITLLSTAYKLYAGILYERLKADIEEEKILGDTQAGIRKDRCTIDNVYIMQHVIEKELKKS